MPSAATPRHGKLTVSYEIGEGVLHRPLTEPRLCCQFPYAHLGNPAAISFVRYGQQDDEGAIDSARMLPHPVDDVLCHSSFVLSPRSVIKVGSCVPLYAASSGGGLRIIPGRAGSVPRAALRRYGLPRWPRPCAVSRRAHCLRCAARSSSVLVPAGDALDSDGASSAGAWARPGCGSDGGRGAAGAGVWGSRAVIACSFPLRTAIGGAARAGWPCSGVRPRRGAAAGRCAARP